MLNILDNMVKTWFRKRDKDHNIKDKDLNDEENEETMPPTDVHNKLAGLDEDNQKISNTTPPQEE